MRYPKCQDRFSSAVCALMLGIPTLLPGSASGDTLPQVYGRTIGQWSAAWWKWAQSIPAPVNPLLDESGQHCGVAQRGPVWFLAGTFPPLGPTVVRECRVPGGKSIFFPIVNAVWVQTQWDDPTNAEPDYRALVAGVPGNRLEACCGSGIRPVAGDLEATLDGVPVVFDPATPIVRTQSPLFRLAEYPVNSIWANAFPYPSAIFENRDSVTDGFWVMLPPLVPGTHLLEFRAGDGQGDWQNITYHLLVGEGPANQPALSSP